MKNGRQEALKGSCLPFAVFIIKKLTEYRKLTVLLFPAYNKDRISRDRRRRMV
jgi:hypothetical protein